MNNLNGAPAPDAVPDDRTVLDELGAALARARAADATSEDPATLLRHHEADATGVPIEPAAGAPRHAAPLADGAALEALLASSAGPGETTTAGAGAELQAALDAYRSHTRHADTAPARLGNDVVRPLPAGALDIPGRASHRRYFGADPKRIVAATVVALFLLGGIGLAAVQLGGSSKSSGVTDNSGTIVGHPVSVDTAAVVSELPTVAPAPTAPPTAAATPSGSGSGSGTSTKKPSTSSKDNGQQSNPPPSQGSQEPPPPPTTAPSGPPSCQSNPFQPQCLPN